MRDASTRHLRPEIATQNNRAPATIGFSGGRGDRPRRHPKCWDPSNSIASCACSSNKSTSMRQEPSNGIGSTAFRQKWGGFWQRFQASIQKCLRGTTCPIKRRSHRVPPCVLHVRIGWPGGASTLSLTQSTHADCIIFFPYGIHWQRNFSRPTGDRAGGQNDRIPLGLIASTPAGRTSLPASGR